MSKVKAYPKTQSTSGRDKNLMQEGDNHAEEGSRKKKLLSASDQRRFLPQIAASDSIAKEPEVMNSTTSIDSRFSDSNFTAAFEERINIFIEQSLKRGKMDEYTKLYISELKNALAALKACAVREAENRNAISNYKIKIQELEKEIEMGHIKRERNSSQITSTETGTKKLELENELLKSRLNEIKNFADQLKEALDTLDSERKQYKELKQKYSMLEDDRQMILQMLQEQKNRGDDAESKLSNLSSKIDDLKDSLSTKAELFNSSRKSKKVVDEQIAFQASILQELKAELNETKRKADLDLALERKRADALASKLDEIKRLPVDGKINTNSSTKKHTDIGIETLQSLPGTKTNPLEVKEREESNKRSEIEPQIPTKKLNVSFHEPESTFEKSATPSNECNHEELDKEISTLKKRLALANESLKEKEDNERALQVKLEATENELKIQQDKIVEKMNAIESLENHEKKASSKKEETERSLKEKIRTLQDTLGTKENTLAEQRANLSALDQNLQEKLKKISELKLEIVQLQEKIKSLERSLEQLNQQLHEERKMYEKKLDSASYELKDVYAKLHSADTATKTLQTRVMIQNKQIVTFEAVKTGLDEKILALEKNQAVLKAYVKKFQGDKNQGNPAEGL